MSKNTEGKITLQKLQKMKTEGTPITMITAYDYPAAMLVDQAGAEITLVGDSLGMVVHGFDSTLPVTMDMMVLHSQAVRRGTQKALLVADMPFGSFQVSLEKAMQNAVRLLQEAEVDAVKLEGGRRAEERIHHMVENGIAVMGHIGLTPQSIRAFGGFRVQGKSVETARQLLDDAEAVQDAGAFAIVLEGIPGPLAAEITARLEIPTIGIGAGVECDGQVLVLHDILGLASEYAPKFVKQYADLSSSIAAALSQFRDEVRRREFPTPDHEYTIAPAVWEAIKAELEG